jgi:hypothetical protein
MTIDLWTEPETDPSNAFFTATLGNFTLLPNGQLRYKDPAGTQNGVTLVRIQPRPSAGTDRITIKRKAAAAIAVPPGGVFRMLLTSGSTCVRHCGSSCSLTPSNRFKCQKSSDTALCGTKSGCELINASSGQCLFPYPSSFFLKDDVTTPTGLKMNYPALGMPINNGGDPLDATAWNDQLDGYSPGTMMLVNFPQGVDAALSGLNTWQNYAPSVNPATSPTILLDADTGELIEHFAENDISIAPGNIPVAPPNQALIVRPGRRLKNSGHYIVALRNLVAIGGSPIQPESVFQALRDGTPTGNHVVEARRSAFETIFQKLQNAGVARSNLIMAWDFHTASDHALEQWLIHMRNETSRRSARMHPRSSSTT